MPATLTVLAVDDHSVHYGPAMGSLEPNEIPTTLFLPRSEYVALGEPAQVVVTVEALVPEPDEDPEPETPEP